MDVEKIFTMTNTQQGILYQSLLEEGIYDEIICCKLNDVLDAEKVKASWNDVAKNNMILRTMAKWGNTKKPVLIVLKAKKIEVKAYSSTKSIDDILEEEQKIGIDIQKHSVRIVLCSDFLGTQYMILISHHLFIDGWSTNLLLSYFWKAYNNQDIHHTKDYQDYLLYLKNIDKNKVVSSKSTDYRLGKMFLPYQTDKKEDIRVKTIKLEKHICAKVLEIQKEVNVSTATIFYGAWALFLGCYNENSYFGITCSGRYREAWNFNDVVGLFMSTAPFVIDFSTGETLRQLYIKTNSRVIDLESQQSESIADISNNRLESFQEFNSICVVENYPVDSNDALEVFRVIEKTHYDCVVQFYISEEIQIKFISNGSINIKDISNKFVEVFSKVINCSLSTKINDVLLSYRYNICIISPFETLPFVNRGKNINRILNLNVSVDTVDLRNVAFMQKKSYKYIYIFLGLEYLAEKNDNSTNAFNFLFERIEELVLQKYNISIVKLEGIYPDIVIDKELLHKYYNHIDSLYSKFSNVEIIDASEKMKRNIEKHYNKNLYYDANVPFDQSTYNVLTDIVYRNIYFKNNCMYKVIVLDCDNTLWKGIVADIGAENIEITKEYLEFQMFLKRKQQEGFLLVLCSKNYNEIVYEAFNFVDMPLKWEDFVAKRINWNKKSDNLLELSKELRLATNSFIFIDDSMVECMEVIGRLPEVFTIPFPIETKNVVTFFEGLWVFDQFKVTSEDANRTQLYISQKKRESVLTDNISENLKRLKIKIYLNRLNKHNSERISQLSYRTNQFNLNGKKIETKECESLYDKNNNYVISAKDEFGKYGIIGFVKYEIEEDIIHISHYFISCRILGKYVEIAILRFLCNKYKDVKYLVFDVYNTGRNQYFQKFFDKIVMESESKNKNKKFIIGVKVFKESNMGFLDEIICTEEEFIPDTCEIIEINKSKKLSATSDADKSMEVYLPEEYLRKIDALDWGKLVRVIYDKKTNAIDDNSKDIEKMHDFDFNITSESFQKILEIWNLVLDIPPDKYYENFYDAGGTSLIAMELVAKISRELEVSIGIADILKNPNLKDLVYLIMCKKSQEDAEIIHVTKDKFIISPLVESIYVMHELSDNIVLNLPYLFEIEGTFHIEKFENNLNKIICNNRIFRTRYIKENNRVYAYVLDDFYLNVEKIVVDTPIVASFFYQYIKRFDLAYAPLIRCFYFVSTAEDRRFLLFDFHHIIMDGQSLSILINAINELYENSFLEFKKEDYFDYTEWYRERNLNVAQLEYWSNELFNSNCKLNIAERVSNNNKYTGKVYDFNLPDDLGKKIRKSSKQNQVSDFVYLLTIYEIFLYKYTGDRSNNIGVPISCRDNTQMMQMMGMLTNTITLKSEIMESESFRTNLHAVKKKVLLAMENKLVALQRVLEHLEVDSLFDTMFVYNNICFKDIKMGDSKLVNIAFHNQVSQKPLILEIIDDGKTFCCNFTYNDDIFSYDSIVLFSRYFIELINIIILNEAETVNKLQVIKSSELTKINEWSVGTNSIYEDVKLIDIFHKTARENLKNTALIYDERKYSYEKINSMANNLACDMLKCGVKEKNGVIFIPDNPLCAAIGILAVMKCGAVYIPVLKTTPVERIVGIVEKSNAKYVFSNDIVIGEFSYKYRLDEKDNGINIDNECDGNDLAYIIFTSGTTGTSKGVMIQNSAIVNSILWRINEFNLDLEDVSILLLGLAFDGFMTSFFTPLLSGTPLVLIDDIRDGKKIVKMLSKYCVTNFITTPTLYNIILDFIEKDSLQDLKKVVLAGESVLSKLLQKSELILPNIELINEYGPTENSVVSTCKRGMSSKDISVGKPISNCKIRIEDVDGNLCPIGFKGEVCLSGNSLAKGYLGNEQETKNVFVNKSNEIWYRTGDIGNWNSKGELCIYGRKDVQCKINGYRVDLSEIEKYVMQMELILFCLVVNSTAFRCYYYSDDFISYKDFVKALSVHLPYYLIPNEFIRINTIPVNQNGKRDESTLEQYVIAPKKTIELDSHLQLIIEECYKDVLGVEDMNYDDNFFSLGGNSMYAIQLQETLKKKLDIDIPVIDIFTFPTVNMMVENISFLSKDGSIRNKKNRYKREVICKSSNKYQYVRLQYAINRLRLVELSNLMNIEEEKIMVSLLMMILAELTEDKKLICFVYLNGNGRLIEYNYQSDKDVKEYLQEMADSYLQLNSNEDINLYIDNTIVMSDKYINIRERKIEEIYIHMNKEEKGYKLLLDVNSSKIRTEKINQLMGKLINILNLDIKEWL